MSQKTASSNQPKQKRRWRVTRRGFLIGAGALAGTAALGVAFGLPVLRRGVASLTEDAGGGPTRLPTEPSAWFEVLEDSRIRLYVVKVEMGQGIHTGLAQLAAEDLGIAVEDIDVVQARSDHGVADASGTGGSNSIISMYTPVRQAAATMRDMLRAEAAKRLNLPIADLEIKNRGVQARGDGARRTTFADLRATQNAWMANIPKELPALKPRAQFSVIGQPVKRVDIPAKVVGQAVYGYDVRLDGMLYGAVLHKPTVAAKLLSVDATAAKQVDGVTQVVIKDGFAGVVATSRAAAQAGVDALNATWDKGKLWQQADIDALCSVGGSGGVDIQKIGNAASAISAPGAISAEYRTPYAIQTPLEAQAGAADVKDGNATVWASTQAASVVQRDVAEALGFKPEQVVVNTTYLGGGFGRKSSTEAVIEAAVLSQAAGAPVHVGWNRESELRQGYLRPPTHHKLSAALDGNGGIAALEHQQASGDVLFTFFSSFVGSLLGADFGAYRGAMPRYNIPNRTTTVWRRDLPVYSGPWRGLGAIANAFAVESFIDELAHAAKADPAEFRLKHLGEEAWGKRMRATIEATIKASGWNEAAPAGRARGIACATDIGTTVCQVAEISLDGDGGIVVHRVTCAIDPGLAINPDSIKAQVEGNVMWGVGSTLIEEARIEDGRVSAANFDGYPLLTIKQAPRVDTILLESDGEPRGIGEPAIAPVAAAIGNALFTLTGKRLRQIPFTPERIRAA
jgi:isoquinoline 1-oxidoreductase beta subunit